MTKRFELVWTDTGEVLHDNETGLDKGIYSPDYRFHVRDMMNELAEENEWLRLQLNLCSDQRNEFHRGARENANCIGKLEKENEQLKSEIEELENENEILKGKLWNCRNVR